MEKELGAAIRALDEGRFEDALAILEPLAESDSDNPEVLLYLGIAYVQTEQPEKAARVLGKAEGMVEEHCILCLFLGRALESLGNLYEAEQCLRRAVALEPHAQEAWEDLVAVLFARRHYGEALMVLEEASQYFPHLPTLTILRAVCYFRLGDYSASEACWRQMVGQCPQSATARAGLVEALITLGRYAEAQEVLRDMQQLGARGSKYHLLHAELLVHAGEYDRAVELLGSVLAERPHSIVALSLMAVAQYRRGTVSEAMYYLRLAESNESTHTQSWRPLMKAYRALGMDDRVIRCLDRGTYADVGAAAPWIALAVEYRRRQMADLEVNAWRKSIELRQYVKVTCPSCGVTSRLRCRHHHIEIPGTQYCERCDGEVPLPAALAVS